MTLEDFRRETRAMTPYDRLIAELRETRRDRDWWRRTAWFLTAVLMLGAMLGWVR